MHISRHVVVAHGHAHSLVRLHGRLIGLVLLARLVLLAWRVLLGLALAGGLLILLYGADLLGLVLWRLCNGFPVISGLGLGCSSHLLLGNGCPLLGL